MDSEFDLCEGNGFQVLINITNQHSIASFPAEPSKFSKVSFKLPNSIY